MKINLRLLLAILAFTFLFWTCTKTGGQAPPPGQEKGEIEIHLTDNPALYTSILVNIAGLEYNLSADSTISTGWQPLPMTAPAIIDLLSLQNGSSIKLSLAQIDPVSFKQLRLRFGNNSNSITHDGVSSPLGIPQQVIDHGAIVPADFSVNADQSISVWIDFNAAASIFYDSSTQVYTLRPKLRTFLLSETGSIEGYISPSEANASVIVKSSTSDTALIDLIAFPYLNNQGYFKIVGLVPGNYQVLIQPFNSNYQSKLVHPVRIETNKTTSLGNISLSESAYVNSSAFEGNWQVNESVTKNIGSFLALDTFMAHTVVLNDSVFGIIQTARTPDPEWVLSTPYANADTLWFVPQRANRILRNTYQGNIGFYSAGGDTLEFTYGFGAPGNYFIYRVKQTWIKQ